MSYSSFLKGIPGALAQPFSIAVLASIGVHGIAAFAIPSFYPAPAEEESQPVGLLNASEINQSGLPALERPPEEYTSQRSSPKKQSDSLQQRTVSGISRSGRYGTKTSRNPTQAQKQPQQRQPTPEEIKKIEKNLNQKLAQLRKKDAQVTGEQRQQNEAYRKKLEEAERQQNEEKQRLAKRAEQQQQRARQNQNDSKDPNPTPNQDKTPENTTTVTSNNDREKDQGFESGQTIPKIALGNGIPKTQEVPPQLREQLTYQPSGTTQAEADNKREIWKQQISPLSTDQNRYL